MVNLNDSSINPGKHFFALSRLGYEFAGSIPLEDVEEEVREYRDCGFDIRFSRMPVSQNGQERLAHTVDIYIRNPNDRPKKLKDGDITDTVGSTFIGHRLGIDRDSLGCYYPLTSMGYKWETNVLKPERLKGVVASLESKGYEVRVNDIAVDNTGQLLDEKKVSVFIRTKEEGDRHRVSDNKDVERFNNGDPIPADISLKYFA